MFLTKEKSNPQSLIEMSYLIYILAWIDNKNVNLLHG